MTDAEQAFEAARAEILRVRAAGEDHLDLKADTYNALTTLPTEIAMLDSVTYIELDDTQITDLSPLESLQGLTRLDLISTPVTDIALLARLANLTELNLDNTNVTDITSLAGLANLTRLYLGYTPVTDITPLAALANLRALDLSNTPVTDIAPLAGLANLATLYLSGTHVTDIAPLAGLANLATLYLSDTHVTDIAPLAGLANLKMLHFSGTHVTDIAPLAGLANLKMLYLSDTPVTDVAPLAELANLTILDLSNTQITNIAPLAALSDLIELSIKGSHVQDLRPLIGLERLGEEAALGLLYESTPASRATPELTRLSHVEDDDHAKCYRDTREYLLTLPPYPEPLPWEVSEDKPDIPANRTAPLQVVEVDGVLHRASPGDGLPTDASDLARQGWQALREFLEDLEDQRVRIGNAMPPLERALTRLDTALTGDYAEMNAVAIGTHGNRVIRQAGLSDEVLDATDAADIQEFAAALALFLERFSDWRTYRDRALDHPVSAEDALDAAKEIEDVLRDLTDTPEVAPDIPQNLNDQIADVREAPDDPIPSTGLIASFSNVAAGLLGRIVPIWKACAAELKDIGGQSWGIAKKGIAATLGGSAVPLVLLGLDLLVTKGATFASLAAKFPTQLGWLQKLLQALGLL
ncbi:leucine-rich repeat domain-containing protein [uncultured Tateyamaria sp.]|uniref:leucine-rich repeat domain-containing protein n=1 Tax=uncultured Tateyamaria sp. TaxID=455651 RepID=UPI002607DA0F|nr:leucine-rich repeat domain-containing protein [uncultured Tateyamaria sp.]